jgi:hypothetical protein
MDVFENHIVNGVQNGMGRLTGSGHLKVKMGLGRNFSNVRAGVAQSI